MTQENKQHYYCDKAVLFLTDYSQNTLYSWRTLCLIQTIELGATNIS